MRFFDYQRNAKRTASRSSSLGSDDGPVEAPSLTQFIADASLYKQVIADPECAALYRSSENETIQDFADLVGRHLDVGERKLADRFARLSVEDSTWLPDDKQTLVEEPEKEKVEQEVPVEPEPVRLQDRVQAQPDETPAPLPETEVEPTSNLTPVEIVELLRQDLGALAPDGEEKLLLEIDAAFVQDVIILVCAVTHSDPYITLLMSEFVGCIAHYDTQDSFSRLSLRRVQQAK